SSRMQLLPPLSTLFPSPTLFLSAVVAVLDDVVHATTRIAIVVVIGLPYVSIRIDSNLIVVSEVVSQNFQLSSIRIASHNHAADVVFSILPHFIAREIDDDVTQTVHHRSRQVTHVEVQFAIGTKYNRMQGMVAGIS